MDKTFNPAAIEQKWYPTWEENAYFEPQGQGESYCVMIPPPNVTGSLHMGHAFQHTLQDALVRLARMQGKKALWQVGTDHAGIATQMVVERKLAAEGQPSRVELGRETFIDKVWEWKEESGGTITRQMRRLGNSVDWQHERFTMDDGFYKAVQEAFVRLYDDGLIYRGKRLVNWDPKLHTAISDLEVESHDEKGFMWHFRYPLADGITSQDGKNYLVVATTRPETMLGDSAVAVSPDDERYAHLIGKFIELPLVGRRIPIVGDSHVDKDFGTGCVKTTPAHDFNDYEIGKRHQLPLINIFDKNAAVLAQAEIYSSDGKPDDSQDTSLPAAYAGLDRYEARKAIVADLDKLGLLEKIDDHQLKVPRGDRSGLVIEPLLTDQWFVDAKTLAKPAIEAVEDGRIKFVPQQYENMYFSWMRDIQDWCISRQLWWGHRIPAWYDTEGNVYVGRDEAAIRAQHNLGDAKLTQDNDVLDTWFSSALWTFGTLGWPENTERLATFHPTDVLVTGFDIIFFWVARMIMMTMHLIKDEQGNPHIPFKTVYVTGLIRDENGEKMSKSKGNVLDPLDMIDGIDLESLLAKRTDNMMQPQLADKIAKLTKREFPQGINEHGTDALRFTLAALASTGRDINWDMKRLEGYRNFCNKLWNAARFVLSNTEGEDCGQDGSEDYELSLADQWILSQLQKCTQSVTQAFAQYRFDLASQAIYEFIWHEYCDWYLELCKPIFWDKNSSPAQLKGTRRTLVRVLDSLLRLVHPIMPFITEEIWQRVKGLVANNGDTIMLQAYPTVDESLINSNVDKDIEWLKAVIIAVRNIRGEMNISPAVALPIYIQKGSEQDKLRLDNTERLLSKLAKLESITWLNDGEEAPLSATQLVGNMRVLVPMAGFIDVEKEQARLNKEVEKIGKEHEKLAARLANENFVNNAPEQVVAQGREKLAEYEAALSNLKQQLSAIQAL